MLRRLVVPVLVLMLAPAALAAEKPTRSTSRRQVPGREGNAVLLPNGWRIAPAGRHLTVGDLPLAVAESPDGGTRVITKNGYDKPSLTVVDLRRLTVPATVPMDDAWLGLAWHPDGKRLYASGGATSTVQELRLGEKGLEKGAVFTLKKPGKTSFVGGLAVSPDGKRLYAVHVLGQTLSAVGPGRRPVAHAGDLPAGA